MAKKKKKPSDVDDPAMLKVRTLWAEAKEKGATMEGVGVAMGYPQSSARKSVSQFLQGHIPRIDVLRNFAKAVGVPLTEIVSE